MFRRAIAIMTTAVSSACAAGGAAPPPAAPPAPPAWFGTPDFAGRVTPAGPSAAVNRRILAAARPSGRANETKNPAMLRSSADNKVRHAVAELWSEFEAVLSKDWWERGVRELSEEQHVGLWIKTIHTLALNGTAIVDHYAGPSTGDMWARAELDLDDLRGRLAKENALPSAMRESMLADFDASFDRWAAARDQAPGK